MANNSVSLGGILSTVQQENNRVAFNYRFSALQNTVIRRLNDEIHKVNSEPEDKAKLIQLQRSQKRINEQVPLLEKYMFDTQSNGLAMTSIIEKIDGIMATMGYDELAGTTYASLTAEEADAINEAKAEIGKSMDYLRQVYYPDISDWNTVVNLKNQDTQALADLAPAEAGTLDASDPDNANGAMFSFLKDFRDRVLSAQTIVTGTLDIALDAKLSFQSKAAEIQSAVTEIGAEKQAKQIKEIEALKEKYAQILQAISLSYEVSADMTSSMTSRLMPQYPAKGSVLNLFS